MLRSIGGPARLAVVVVLGLAMAACVAERPQLGPPVIPPTKLKTLGPASIKGAEARFAFARVANVPGAVAFAFEDALRAVAATRKLTILEEDDPTATYRVKGYLSAIGDTNGILMVYVWDVFDANGTRVHRITGQEPAEASGADPWAGVKPKVIDNAARETVDALADWVRG